MPGVTKHIFNHEICDILSMFNCEIKTIEPLLSKATPHKCQKPHYTVGAK